MYYFAWVCSQFDSLLHQGLQPARLLCPGKFPARKLEYVDISSSRGSFWPRNGTQVSSLLHWQTDYLPLTHLGSQMLLRHLNVSGKKTYFIKMIAWWYINFFTLCLQCQLCWLCYYHNFSLLITVLVYAKQITCPHYPKLMLAMKSPE